MGSLHCNKEFQGATFTQKTVQFGEPYMIKQCVLTKGPLHIWGEAPVLSLLSTFLTSLDAVQGMNQWREAREAGTGSVKGSAASARSKNSLGLSRAESSAPLEVIVLQNPGCFRAIFCSRGGIGLGGHCFLFQF